MSAANASSLQRQNQPSFGAADLTQMFGDDASYLKTASYQRPKETGRPEFRYVDLFSGCGGMSLGIEEAAVSAGYAPRPVLAVDNMKPAADVYRANLAPDTFHEGPIQDLLGEQGSRLSPEERELKAAVGRVHLVAGGPPCQGHSDLNNYSRRNDPKNALYNYMGRAAEVFEPTFLIAENVQGLPHDRSGALQRTIGTLERLGYSIWDGLVDAVEIGIPQTRRRHVLVASRMSAVDVGLSVQRHRTEVRDVRWAIGDLLGRAPSTIVDEPSRPSADNARRIGYLFDHDIFDLPNEQRPPCHRDKAQTYSSVYGRLRWDRPSQTITSGFYSMCMGRYVHPVQRRTLTAHEAARLQFLPDFFDLSAARNRTSMAKLIANAVPPKLAFVLANAALTQLGSKQV